MEHLLLNPGSYTCTSITLVDGARLLAIAGTVTINVSGQLTAGRRVRICPAFGRSADCLAISVSGYDTSSTQPSVSLGENCFVRALLFVPHGTLAVADHTHAIGAFVGFDITLGKHVDVEFQSGFPVDQQGSRGSQQLQGYYGPNPNPSVAPLIGPVPPDTNIAIGVGLPVRDPAGLQTTIQQVSDPKSPNFRQFLTQTEFTQTYGATAADFTALSNWATSNGFSIFAAYSNNLYLGVTATAAQIQSALYVNLLYRQASDGTPFVTVDRDPSIDLSVTILQISGLTDFRVPQPSNTVHGTGSGGASYAASDIRNAYLGSDPEIMKLDGTGQVVGLFELNSYNTSDIAGYDANQNPQLNPSNVVLAWIQAPPVFTSYSNDAETALDIEMVQAMAPGATVLVIQCALGITSHGDAGLHAMATSNPPLTSASCSYSFGRSGNAQQALDQLAVQGVSFFVASGDYGDIGDPQSNLDMNSQTLVGGTFLSTNALTQTTPTVVYPSPYYAGESTWNQHNGFQQKGVTGGGVMDGHNKNGQCYCWPYTLGPFSCCGSGVGIPDYQTAIMQLTAPSNGGSQTWRNYPDVAMVADNLEVYYNGQTIIQAGTSAAAPLWAGYMALINQRIKSLDPTAGLAGFINPTIYDIGLTHGSDNDLYSVCFNDIVGDKNYDGFGSGFTAVPGYDLCTGLGSPKVGLIYQMSSPTPLTSNQPLALIRFVIETGNDDAGGGQNGSEQTADVLLKNGTQFTVVLRTNNKNNKWANWTTHTVDNPIPNTVNPPLTQSNPIAGVRINLVQSNPSIAADNWDVASLAVSLFNPPYNAATAVCQLNLVGNNTLQDGSTGLFRLSQSAGSSGDGPHSPVYYTGPGSGCP